MADLSVVGKSVLRKDAWEKVTGKGKYTIDLKLPGMLHAKILRSPYPHARILSIDTSRAENLPGVKAVVTARDAPSVRDGNFVFDQYIPARDVVRFVGEPVAAVAAVTREAAEEALDLIDVEYEELPAVFDLEEAGSMEPPAVLHPDLAKYRNVEVQSIGASFEVERPNVHKHFKIRHGDIERGFKEADLILEGRFSRTRMQHCQMEPHTAIAQAEPDGGLTVWSGRQGIYRAKMQLSSWLGIPASKIRVICPYVGGAFGGKIAVRPEPFVALLALRTGKPVKLTFTREEVFVGATTESPMVIYLKDGVKKDGAIVAREMTVFLNGGAYADYMPLVTRNCAFGAVGSYKTPNFKFDSYGVYTNEPIAGPLRGLGSQHVIWAIESHMDLIAEKLGIDPVELRKKNILHEGDVNVTGEITHSIAARECLEAVAKAIDWGKQPLQPGGAWRVGKGIALGNKYSVAPTAACAIVKVNEDCIIELRHSAEEIGQGVNTVLAQMVAEEFSLPMENIKVTFTDTALTPYDPGPSSSRVTYNTGNAVRLACQDAKRQMFQIASSRLEVPPHELETRAGKVYIRSAPDVSMTITDLFRTAGPWGRGFLEKGAEILGKATWIQAFTPEDKETGQIDPAQAQRGMRLVSFWIHGAQAVEAAVNVETGQIKVLKMASAFDMGQPINPKLCEAQIEGGVGMGIGWSLFEELAMDNGVALNPTFMDYKVPSVAEMPHVENVASFLICAPHKDGPFGAKGLGEGALTPTAPAIASAIHNAVGVRIQDLPITREKVLEALRQVSR
ncbi:MAG: xanthine dehydrogenase family protein molybdopterin-binding subunit [Chloroflexi bacterium]|nr:xanthine dehydrogenase family protein molybdopterin-binding subunit [Chloroflexota bacterium]